jgi:hypothetical protein
MNPEFVEMVLKEACSFSQESFLQALFSVDGLKFTMPPLA